MKIQVDVHVPDRGCDGCDFRDYKQTSHVTYKNTCLLCKTCGLGQTEHVKGDPE